jgi:hypothetical protein
MDLRRALRARNDGVLGGAACGRRSARGDVCQCDVVFRANQGSKAADAHTAAKFRRYSVGQYPRERSVTPAAENSGVRKFPAQCRIAVSMQRLNAVDHAQSGESSGESSRIPGGDARPAPLIRSTMDTSMLSLGYGWYSAACGTQKGSKPYLSNHRRAIALARAWARRRSSKTKSLDNV